MDLIQGQRISHYVILDRLGSGGMGVVYRAEDVRLKRTVALKSLLGRPGDRPDRARRLLREAESAAALNHPRIAHVYEVDEHDGVPFIAMEHLPGGSLRERLSRGRPSTEDVLRWSADVAEALAEAHDHGIIHRDVKPANILLDEKGNAKLADFGLARQALPDADQATETRLTEDGVLLGTPGYLSPEAAQGRPVGAAADVFALGCSMYELLAGRLPFERATWLDTLHALVHDAPPPFRDSGLPPGLGSLIERLLDKQTERRPSARAVAEELRGISGVWRSVSDAPTIAIQQGSSAAGRRILVLAAAGALVAAGLAVWLWPPRPALDFKARETVMIGGVANSTGESALDGSLATALQISLEQSRYVNVLTPERVRQALQRMRQGDAARLSEEVAREVCRREGAQALLSGSVERVGDAYLLTVRIVDPVSGASLRTLSRRTDDRGKILASLDDLARDARSALGESLPAISRGSPRLAEATTSSLEALQLYSEARGLSGRGRADEARRLLERAIELDPDFTRAYAALAVSYRSFNFTVDEALAERYFQQAIQRLDRVGERERLEIQALYNAVTGRSQQAESFYRLLVERHPDVDEYHYDLARTYMAQARHRDAIAEFETALKLNPRSAQALISLATSYAGLREPAQQVAYLERAFALEPEWEIDQIQNHQYGWALILTRHEDRARATFAKMLAKGGAFKARGHRSLGLLALYRGQVEQGLRELGEAARVNETTGGDTSAARDRLYAAEALTLLAREKQALAELAGAGTRLERMGYRPAWIPLRLAALHARLGRTSEAARLIEAARARVLAENTNQRADLMRAEGELQLARGQTEQGLESIRRAQSSWAWWLTRSSLARALARAGRATEAVAAYRSLVDDGPESWEGQLDWAIAQVRLAQLLEQTGQAAAALAVWNRLVTDVWKQADPDLAPLLEARRARDRLAATPAVESSQRP